MHHFRTYLSILLIITIAFVTFLYFFVQTVWGATILSQQLSKYMGYTISIGKIDHSIFRPDEISLENFVINKNQSTEPAVTIPKLVIGLDRDRPWQFKHLNFITIFHGVIDDLNLTHSLVTANSMQFVDTTINLHLTDDEISLQNATGGIKPFISSSEKYQFDLTAQTLLFNNLPFTSLLIQGYQHDGIMHFTNIGGSFKKGFFVGKLDLLADNSLDISQLQINNLNFQSTVEHDEFSDFLTMLPKMHIRRFSLIDSSFLFPNFFIEKGNIEATNLDYDNGWHLTEGKFIFNAQNLTWYNQHFVTPLLQLKRDSNKIIIEKALAIWNEGNLNLTGSWQDDNLQLDQLIIAGANYQYEFTPVPLPSYIKQIAIKSMMILPSTLIATNSNYPFRFSDFEISGSNLIVAKNGQFGLYSGDFYSKAESGTFQGVNLKYPDFTAKIVSENRLDLIFSTMLDQGVLDSSTTIDLAKAQFSALKLNAYNVDSAILTKWKLVKNPPSANNFTADLNGNMAAFDFIGTIFANNSQYPIESQH